MAQKRRFNPHKRHPLRTSVLSGLQKAPSPGEIAPAVVYGDPFIVLEDEDKNTFIYEGGAWVPYSASIAECRKTCQVRELPQRVNRKIRYEIRCPSQGA
jgi:hypothetical protein